MTSYTGQPFEFTFHRISESKGNESDTSGRFSFIESVKQHIANSNYNTSNNFSETCKLIPCKGKITYKNSVYTFYGTVNGQIPKKIQCLFTELPQGFIENVDLEFACQLSYSSTNNELLISAIVLFEE